MKKLSSLLAVFVVVLGTTVSAVAEEKAAGKMATVKGEILDMGCYLDHGATGEKHATCAKTCIEGGLPVGIKGEDGKVYLVIGDHKPINSELVEYAAKTVTLRGKLVTRDGINLLANAELVK
jgi:hypothetical protein